MNINNTNLTSSDSNMDPIFFSHESLDEINLPGPLTRSLSVPDLTDFERLSQVPRLPMLDVASLNAEGASQSSISSCWSSSQDVSFHDDFLISTTIAGVRKYGSLYGVRSELIDTDELTYDFAIAKRALGFLHVDHRNRVEVFKVFYCNLQRVLNDCVVQHDNAGSLIVQHMEVEGEYVNVATINGFDVYYNGNPLDINTWANAGGHVYTKHGLSNELCPQSLLHGVMIEKDGYQSFYALDKVLINCNIGAILRNFFCTLDALPEVEKIVFIFKVYGMFIIQNREPVQINPVTTDFTVHYFDRKFKKRHTYLVGIELNPGPNDLVTFLRNMEKCVPAERSHKKQAHKKPKILQLEQKENDKKNTKKINTKRLEKQKKNLFVPEGLFEVSLSGQDRDLILRALDHIQAITSDGIDVNVKPLSQIYDFFLQILSKIKNYGDFAVGVFWTAFGRLADELGGAWSVLFEMLAGFTNVFKPEGLISGGYALYAARETLVKCVGDYDIIAFIKSFDTCFSKASTIDSFIDRIVDFVVPLVNSVLTYFGVEYQIPYEYSGDEIIDTFYLRLHKLRATARNGSYSDYEFSMMVFALQDEIETMLLKGVFTGRLKDKITFLQKELKPLVAVCETTVNPNNGPRVEPLGLLIAGPTGVGKSSITMPLLLALLSNIISEDQRAAFNANHNDFIFFRANENEFFDGYKRNHLAVVYDDFGQQKDTAGSPSLDAFEIIRLINSAPYQLHYSSITEKSRNYASPRIVMATSNRAMLHFNSIVSNPAVIRRFKIAYVQVPKLEFCVAGSDTNIFSRALDMKKVRAKYPYVPSDPATFISTDVLEYYPWDFVTGHPTGEPIGFDDLFLICKQELDNLSNKGQAMLSFHSYIKDKYKPEGLQDDFLRITEGYVPSFNKGHVDTIMKVALAVASTLAVVKIAKMFLLSKPNSEGGTMNSAPDEKNAVSKGKHKEEKQKQTKGKPGKNKDVRIRKARDRKFGPLFEGNENVDIEFMVRLVKRNMYRLRVKGRYIGYATFVEGSTFFCPRHFDDLIKSKFEDDEEVVVEFCSLFNDNTCFVIDWFGPHHLIMEDEEDFMIVEITSKVCRDHASIRKFFLPHKKVKAGDKVQCVSAVIRENKIVFFSPVVNFSNDTQSYSFQSTQYVATGVSYSMPSQPGDCGALLVTADTRYPHPVILAMHTAGTPSLLNRLVTKHCLGVFVDQELLETNFDNSGIKVEEIGVNDSYDKFLSPEACYDGFTVLRQENARRTFPKTKLELSPLAPGLWPTTTAPAVLGPTKVNGVLVDPSDKARAVYMHPEPHVDTDHLDLVTSVMTQIILKDTTVAPWKPRLFTLEESVAGIDGVPYCEGLARQTSTGYPMNLNSKTAKKKNILGSEGPVNFLDEKVQNFLKDVREVESKLRTGVRPEFIFTDSLKDERRSLEKVAIAKTRQFNGGPMTLTVLTKRFFGDFIRHICSNHIYNTIALGINPYTEWVELWNYLKGRSHLVTAGDYSGYDGKIPVAVGWRFLQIVETFYAGSPAEDVLARRVLFHEIINSFHIHEGVVYELVGGNSSGNALTSIYNSICNVLMLSDCITHDLNDIQEISHRLNAVRIIVFGDDNVLTYPQALKELCSQSSITSLLKSRFNMTYTIETKDDNPAENRKLEEVEFLKRTFKSVNGTITAPLRLEVVLETLSWIKKPYIIHDLELRVEATLSELSLHGKEIFSDYSPRIIAASRNFLNYTPVNATFNTAFNSEWTLSN